MKNEQILKKAINKAVKNSGEFKWKDFYVTGLCDDDNDLTIQIEYDLPSGKRSKNVMCQIIEPEQIIFSHDFAKALGYKLKDLGDWCDNGNEPLDFIKQLTKI